MSVPEYSTEMELPILNYRNHNESHELRPTLEATLGNFRDTVSNSDSMYKPIPARRNRGLKCLLVFLNVLVLVTILVFVLIHPHYYTPSEPKSASTPTPASGSATASPRENLNPNPEFNTTGFELKLKELQREFERRINSMAQNISTMVEEQVVKLNESFIEEQKRDWRLKVCGDASWTPFPHPLQDKCFKLLEDKMTFEEADESCRGQSGNNSLLNIGSLMLSWDPDLDSDSNFENNSMLVSQLLSTIGMNLTGEIWIAIPGEGSAPQNSLTGGNKNESENEFEVEVAMTCQELADSDNNLVVPANCTNRNWVICQKHVWPMSIVPIGFIYTEYSGQLAPREIWPAFTWAEVTSSYQGQFFRALGGASSPFGQVQQGNSPRITRINKFDDPDTGILNSVSCSPGAWSSPVRAGFHASSSSDKAALQFYTSAGEVRPLNSAIKIWKRTA